MNLTTPWFEGATPHPSIQEGKVNEALFEAKLGEVIRNRGPVEYRDAQVFFEKTYLTAGLRRLLLDILSTLNGERAANAVINLKTSFGGGKTHTELAIYHLFEHAHAAMRVPHVRELVAEAGLSAPPPAKVAVLPCTRFDPTGYTTPDGVHIRTLWGEMAYRLNGEEGFAVVAEADAQLVSPGEDALEAVLRQVEGPVILIDETLHYVDKVAKLTGAEGDLAKQTVAFLRELSAVVDALPRAMLVISLTASAMDQISSEAQDWLERMERHVNRLARPCTPIEGTEIHEVVRRRLFERVEHQVAERVAERYARLYRDMGGLPGQYVDAAYRDLIRRSYPFHPELITVLYERWGAKPGFQLTRGTLRFLALVLQDLWQRQDDLAPDLIQMGHVAMEDSSLRAMVRTTAGDPQWESVIGSDVSAPASSDQPAKAELIDAERTEDAGLAQALATTILLYSVGGGENPNAARHEIRLACARPGVEDATWEDLLDKFRRRFFYLYYDDAHYQFRKEPNVTSLQHTYRVNLQDTGEISAHIDKIMLDKALGRGSPSHGFARIYYLPTQAVDRDDETLTLVVLGFDQPVESNGTLAPSTHQTVMDIMEHHGQRLRQHRNMLVFCAPDREALREARNITADYLGWRKIQRNATDWDRIGGAQQALVKDQLEDTASASQQAITRAYHWAIVPGVDKRGTGLTLNTIPLGVYGPGKQIAAMVWDTLTAKTPSAQWLLKDLTAETFIERYGPRAWPASERWVTTAQLWQRFTSQVGLPILANENVLLDMLKQGQYEGWLAIGALIDAQAPRDQRDSYVHLYFEETMPPNVPVLGERQLVMRSEAYRQIAEQPEQVTPQDIAVAVEEMGGGEHPILVKALQKVVASDKRHNIDEGSFHQALATVLTEEKFGLEINGVPVSHVPDDKAQAIQGVLTLKEKGPTLAPQRGRTIKIAGSLGSINDMAPFFKKILQPIASQKPEELTIELEIRAHFAEDPGSGLDATLDDGFDNDAFPGLSRKDSKSG
jgi:hypothetical protein